MQSKYHMIEKRKCLEDVPTGREMFVIFALWLAAMLGLGYMALNENAARAETRDPPLISEISRKGGADRLPPIAAVRKIEKKDTKLLSPEDSMCLFPSPTPPSHIGVLLQEPINDEERALVEVQINRCKRDVRGVADPFLVLAVLRLEKELDVPPEARGILGSVWCIEAAMRVEGKEGGPVRGDYHGGTAMAHGPAQLWPWHRDWCGLTDGGADDLVASLTCYWQRVVDRREKRAMNCEDSWRVGEALAANGPKYKSWGCKAKSSHWRELERWTEKSEDVIIAE
jgi:hypothetical protein